MLRVNQFSGFGGVVDTTAPIITSGNSVTVTGGTTLSFTVTTDEPSTITIGGDDAAEVEIASNDLRTTHTLRWVSDGTRSHGSPADADSDNVYDITLTPTDGSLNAGTPQSFSITVDYDWVDSGSFTVTTETVTDFNGYTMRQIIPASLLSQSGSLVRLLLRAGSSDQVSIDKIYIGEKASSGDAYDMKASAPAPTQLLFSGGATKLIPTNSEAYTDALSFSIDETKDYVISAHFNASSSLALSTPTGATLYRHDTLDEASVANATSSGYIQTSNTVALVKKVQVAP